MAVSIELSSDEALRLKEIVRSQTAEARAHRRARMVLLASSGESIAAIARRVGTNRSRVGDWLRRFEEERLAGLVDAPRSGRPAEISALERHQVIAAACKSPTKLGLERTVWSHEALAQAVTSQGLVRSISSSAVGRILQEAEIKPHRVQMWCHSSDPDYQDKMKAIVRLYVEPPTGEPVLCIDEKTGMQALSRSRPLEPATPGRAGRFEFEYRRHGTRCLFACFNVRSGKVLGHCTLQRRREDFFDFLDRVARVYRQPRVHVVLDNLNTHIDSRKRAYVSEWNQAHGGRFHFHYTPTHGSWLNQVELWFSILSRRVLRYGSYEGAEQLVAAVDRFISSWNEHAHPFRWTYQGRPLVR